MRLSDVEGERTETHIQTNIASQFEVQWREKFAGLGIWSCNLHIKEINSEKRKHLNPNCTKVSIFS